MHSRKSVVVGLFFALLPSLSFAQAPYRAEPVCAPPSEAFDPIPQSAAEAREIATHLKATANLGCDSVDSSLKIISKIKNMPPGAFDASLREGPHEQQHWDSCFAFLGMEKAKVEASIHALCSRFGEVSTLSLTTAERARKIMAFAHEIKEKTTIASLKQIPSSTIACIASRESGGNFMPTSVSFSNCQGTPLSVSFQIGFGAILWTTFLDVLGYDKSQFTKEDDPDYPIRALKTRFKIPTSSVVKDPFFETPLQDVEPKNPGTRTPLISKVSYDGRSDLDPYQLTATELYDAVSTNAELQVEIMMLILSENLDKTHGKISSALRGYNGDADPDYQSHVSACSSCIVKIKKNGKTSDDVSLTKCLQEAATRN